ncbi:hypothetical protein [Geminocystis sp.]
MNVSKQVTLGNRLDFELANSLFNQAQVFVNEIKQNLAKVGVEI